MRDRNARSTGRRQKGPRPYSQSPTGRNSLKEGFALLPLGVDAGNKVITTTKTLIATAGAISYIGVRPVFVDVEPAGGNMDQNLVEGPARTEAILLVHLYGCPLRLTRPRSSPPGTACCRQRRLPERTARYYQGRRVEASGEAALSFLR